MPFLNVNRLLHIVHRTLKKTINDKRLTINKPAFTLIELIIVIAIIGILSSVGFYGYQSSQQKARDAQRKNDLQMVKRALESAKNDCLAGSFYPTDVNGFGEDLNYYQLVLYLSTPELNYIDNVIFDPVNSKIFTDRDTFITSDPRYDRLQAYRFAFAQNSSSSCSISAVNPYGAQGSKYFVLRAKLEISNDPDNNKSRIACSPWIDNINANAANNDGFGLYGDSEPPTPNDGFYYVCPD